MKDLKIYLHWSQTIVRVLWSCASDGIGSLSERPLQILTPLTHTLDMHTPHHLHKTHPPCGACSTTSSTCKMVGRDNTDLLAEEWNHSNQHFHYLPPRRRCGGATGSTSGQVQWRCNRLPWFWKDGIALTSTKLLVYFNASWNFVLWKVPGLVTINKTISSVDCWFA